MATSFVQLATGARNWIRAEAGISKPSIMPLSTAPPSSSGHDTEEATGGAGGGQVIPPQTAKQQRAAEKAKEERMENESLLWLAALHGSLRSVLLYIDVHECDVNATKDGWTPLLVSCYKGHMDVIKLLLARGADIEMPSEDGLYTPLFAAATQGRMAVVKLLLGKVVYANVHATRWGVEGITRTGTSIPPLLLQLTSADVWTFTSQLHSSLSHTRTHARDGTQSHRAHAPPLPHSLTPPLPHPLPLLSPGAGALVNRGGGEGFTPARGAADRGFYDIANLLREKGGK